jgi:hypothetical protein
LRTPAPLTCVRSGTLLEQHPKKISPLNVAIRAKYSVIRVLQAGLFGIDRAQEGKDILGCFGSFWIVGLKLLSFAERAAHRHSARRLR